MHTAATLITAQVTHRRLRPVVHSFVYPVFLIRVNLATADDLNSPFFGVNKFRLMSLYDKDYGPRDGSALLPWIRHLLAANDILANGEIFLQTFPRILGYAFNPVSIWYCHGTQGQLCALLAEVNNTFGEHHLYLLRSGDGSPIDKDSVLISKKMMHVSPFCEVQGNYRFRLRDNIHSCQVKIDYDDDEGLLIETAISGKKFPFTTKTLLKALLRQPFLTFGVMWRIHWQALLLWRKRVPFFRQPSVNPSLTDSEPEVSVSHGYSQHIIRSNAEEQPK